MKAIILIAITILNATANASDCVGKNENKFVEFSTSMQEIEDKASQDLRQEINRFKDEYKQLNAIGMISVDGRKYDGSAWMVDSCHVLTNAHVAYDDNEVKKDGKEVFFSVGQTGRKSQPFYHDKLRGRIIGHGNYDGTETTYNSDWAIVKLDQNIEDDNIEPIQIVQMDPTQMQKFKYATAGFPGNRSMKDNFSKMYGDLDCKILGLSVYGHVRHNCQSTSGQSGSPILVKSPKNSKYYAFYMMRGHPEGETGLNKTADLSSANTGVNFDSGALDNVVSEGDKIVRILTNDPCPQ